MASTLTFSTKSLVAVYFLLVWLMAVPARASLAVGDTRGAICATIAVPVTLNLPPNAIAAQFDLAFPASSFLGVGLSNSPAFSGQRLDAWAIAPGSHRVLVWSPESKPLPRQGLVNVTLYITTNAPLGQHEITATELIVSGAEGQPLDAGMRSGGQVLVISPEFDHVPPTVTLAEPARNSVAVSASGLLPVRGGIADNVGVCEVQWRLNGSAFGAVPAISRWEAMVQARPGSNWLEVTAIDGAGLRSPTIGRTFYWRPAHALALNQIGGGRIAGATNGQPLEIGRRYVLTATADKGWLFAGWTGDVVTESAVMSFEMRSNFTVRATFVTNRFPGLAGMWSGLVRETPARAESSGLATLSVTSAGAFSGKLLIGGMALPLSGRVGVDGRFEGAVPRPGQTATMQVMFELPFENPSGPLRGTVSTEGWTAELAVYRSAAPPGLPGGFTAVIPHAEGAPVRAEGDGVLTLAVAKSGAVSGAGTLGDTTPVSFSARLNATGSWPFYAPLYGKNGALIGWGTFAELPDTDLVSDELHWIKPAGGSRVDTAGFTNVLTLDGSRYQKSQRPVEWTNGMAWLVGGDLPALSEHLVRFEAGRFAVSNNVMGFNFKLAASGALSGGFTDPASQRKTSLRGVIHQKRSEGAGNFSGPTSSGRLYLEGR